MEKHPYRTNHGPIGRTRRITHANFSIQKFVQLGRGIEMIDFCRQSNTEQDFFNFHFYFLNIDYSNFNLSLKRNTSLYLKSRLNTLTVTRLHLSTSKYFFVRCRSATSCLLNISQFKLHGTGRCRHFLGLKITMLIIRNHLCLGLNNVSSYPRIISRYCGCCHEAHVEQGMKCGGGGCSLVFFNFHGLHF